MHKQQPAKRGTDSAATTAVVQDEDKARKEAEFKAIKELAEMRRDPKKMAAYEDEVHCMLTCLV